MKMTFIVSFGDDADEEWGSSLAKRCIDPWIVIKVAFWYYLVQLVLKIPLNMFIEIAATEQDSTTCWDDYYEEYTVCKIDEAAPP